MQRPMTPLPAAQAELVALQALEWLATQDDVLTGFLGASGAVLADVPALAGDPTFLGAVLDFILTDDAWVLGFAAAIAVPPDHVLRARAGLPGGDLPHWT